MKRFWLIRHGQSEGNVGLPIAYRGSPPLTDLGHKQAKATAKWFPTTPDLIVTSPYLRTGQTAEPLQRRFPNVAHQEWEIQEFSPLSAEKYAGRSARERSDDLRAYYERSDPFYVDGDKAESLSMLAKRSDAFFAQLKREPFDHAAIFTHGMFMRALVWQWLNPTRRLQHDSLRHFRSFRHALYVPNCAVIAGLVSRTGRIYLDQPQFDHVQHLR